MTLAEELFPRLLPYVGGLAGLTVVYCAAMIFYTVARHHREKRMEKRQIRIEQMQRDLWLDWMRRRR